MILASALACQQVPEELDRQENTPTPQIENPIQQANLYLGDSLAKELEARENAPATKAGELGKYLNEIEVISIERLFPDAGEFEARTREAGLHKWYTVTYRKITADTKTAASVFEEIPGVEAVSPIRKPVQNAINYPFNDPRIGEQWAYYNDGTVNGGKAGVDVNVLPVWNNITTGSKDVVVAVVDSGVDYAHEDLSGVVNRANSRNLALSNSEIHPEDHGTHVAGTIAAINNNGKGVAGIAGGNAAAGVSGTTIISCQIFDGTDVGSGAVAIKWAADHGAVLCNNSWGYDLIDDKGNFDLESAKRLHEFFLQPNTGAYKDPLKDAVDYFNTYAGMDASGKQVGPMAGGVCFFSAGNDSQPYGYPSSYPGMIAVGALGPGGVPAYYSNYGEWIDIAAPGGDSRYVSILSTWANNRYGYYQGTSMACPHATGVAALVVAACGGPGFTREMLLEKMLNGTNPNVQLSGSYVGKLVDAYTAINYGDLTKPDPVSAFTLEPKSNTLTASWKVSAVSDRPAAGFLLLYGSDKADVEASTPSGAKESVKEAHFVVSSEKVGTTVSMVLPELQFETTYYARIYAYSPNLIFSDASSTVAAMTQKNNPPVITSTEDLSQVQLKASETRSFVFIITDVDGHDISVSHTPGSDGETWRANPDGSYTIQVDAKKSEAGAYTSRIQATDLYGAQAEFSFSYRILENNPPTQVKDFENHIFTKTGESVSYVLADYFTDVDEDNLTFSATNTSTGTLHVSTASGKLTCTAIADGLSLVTITASDPLGMQISASFKVAVRTSSFAIQAYPSQVKDYVYVSSAELNPISVAVTIVSSTGGKVFEGTVQASAFEPASIDLSKCAPGVYSFSASYADNSFRQTIVKL